MFNKFVLWITDSYNLFMIPICDTWCDIPKLYTLELKKALGFKDFFYIKSLVY